MYVDGESGYDCPENGNYNNEGELLKSFVFAKFPVCTNRKIRSSFFVGFFDQHTFSNMYLLFTIFTNDNLKFQYFEYLISFVKIRSVKNF